MKASEKEFNDSQKRLREEGTDLSGDFQDQVKEGRRKAALLGKMKDWGGPITCQEDLTNLLEKYEGWETQDQTDQGHQLGGRATAGDAFGRQPQEKHESLGSKV